MPCFWNRWILFVFWSAFVFRPSFAAETSARPRYQIGPPGAWVEAGTSLGELPRPAESAGSSSRYIMVDEQVSPHSHEYYLRKVLDLLNEQGVQDSSTVTITFDPSYQQLTIHRVQVWRGGLLLDRLDSNRLRLLEQENDAAVYHYRMDLQASLVLEDIRVGDRLEVAYTLKGDNPVFGGQYVGRVSGAWLVPIAHRRFRLLGQEGKLPNWKLHGAMPPPKLVSRGAERDLVWELQDCPAIELESDMPSWFDPFPWAQLSTFESWSLVESWGRALFPESTKLPPDLEKSVVEWDKLPTKEQQARAALQFVQDEIRYVSISLGASSHQPAPPETVVTRRFGDCKDKSYLLVTLLHRLGITAYPLLVNTAAREMVVEWWPSPLAFDHAVVLAEIEGETLVLDPTSNFQRGPISRRFVPDYGRGLVLGKPAPELTVLPPTSVANSTTEIDERFRIGMTNQPTELQVTTIAYGRSAEYLRQMFATQDRQAITRNFRDYYGRLYPKAEAVAPIEPLDRPDENAFQTVERYRLPEFWVFDPKIAKYKAEFVPREISRFAQREDNPKRSAPLRLIYPQRIRVRTDIRTPIPWVWKADFGSIAGPGIQFSYWRNPTQSEMLFQCDLQTLADHVAVKDFAEDAANAQRMNEMLGYTLTWGIAPQPAPNARPIHWSMLRFIGTYTMALMVGVGLILLRPGYAGVAAKGTVPPILGDAPPLLDRPDPLRGLGGWLILVGVQLFLRPLFLLGSLSSLESLLYADRWNALTDPQSSAYHVLWGPLLVFEAVVTLLLLAVSVLQIGLFFQERRLFRTVYMSFLIGSAVFVLLEYFGLTLLPHSGSPPQSNLMGSAIQATAGAVIWCWYLAVSVRVKRTFIR